MRLNHVSQGCGADDAGSGSRRFRSFKFEVWKGKPPPNDLPRYPSGSRFQGSSYVSFLCNRMSQLAFPPVPILPAGSVGRYRSRELA